MSQFSNSAVSAGESAALGAWRSSAARLAAAETMSVGPGCARSNRVHTPPAGHER
ncbi:hypothetical protein [Actinokineospora iranica]|uniref:hypothetical protein n=1 Tax=Actinokineospora iranica TaxID=1271860 RepID=UPI001586FC39|nr:hypothetical protein [Actinokineospora iranica]